MLGVIETELKAAKNVSTSEIDVSLNQAQKHSETRRKLKRVIFDCSVGLCKLGQQRSHCESSKCSLQGPVS